MNQPPNEDLLQSELSASLFALDAAGADLPSRARVVVVGAGIVGASVAYHLVRLGVKDVLVLDQASVAAGTSWHAAGPDRERARLARHDRARLLRRRAVLAPGAGDRASTSASTSAEP